MATAREIAFDHVIEPGIAYLKSALFKIHFWNAGTPDEAKAQNGFFDRAADRLICRKFAKFGPDGKGAGETSVFAELGWIATNFAVVVRELGEVKGILRSLALGQGVTIDYDEIARKVADEQDRRDRERLDATKVS